MGVSPEDDLSMLRLEITRSNATRRPREMYDMTCSLALLGRIPAETRQLLAALQSKEADTGCFFGTIAGTVPISEFFQPSNLRRIIDGAPRNVER